MLLHVSFPWIVMRQKFSEYFISALISKKKKNSSQVRDNYKGKSYPDGHN